MRDTFLPFSKPDLKENDLQSVVDVLRSGWITTGPKVAQFESDFKAYLGASDAVSMTSETGVMEVMLHALGIGPGDEVITPSMTWVSMVNLTVLAGATPVFCEVDRETLLATPETIAAAITPRTKMIVPVHFAGAALDLDGIYKVAGGIPVIEDAAHAVGTCYKGRHIGSRGTAIYSFHAIKNVTTGEGGMVTTNDRELAEAVRRWKFHGIASDTFDRENRGRSPQAEVVDPGFKYNLTDICAAIGVSQLKRLVNINTKRRELAMLYRELLAEVPEIRPLADPKYDFKHAWHLFVVRVDSPKMDRNEFMAALKGENIGTGLHFRCVHLQKYYREVMGFRPGMLPATEYNSDHICSLPLFPDMTPEDVRDVVAAIKHVLGRK